MTIKRLLASFICASLLTVSGIAATFATVADAAMKRDLAAVRLLLEQKADVNAAQADGATALHWAVRWDDLELADRLLRAGANASAANLNGATTLLLAALNGNAAMIDRLIQAGADPNAPVGVGGDRPLMIAARTGKI